MVKFWCTLHGLFHVSSSALVLDCFFKSNVALQIMEKLKQSCSFQLDFSVNFKLKWRFLRVPNSTRKLILPCYSENNEFLKKQWCFILKIFRFLLFWWMCKLQNLWLDHRHYTAFEVLSDQILVPSSPNYVKHFLKKFHDQVLYNSRDTFRNVLYLVC